MAHLRKKILVLICGVFFLFIALELLIRAGGFVFVSLQEHRNKISIRQKGTYKIMCLGESTTAWQYPRPLEEILNQRNTGVKFSVIDKGIPGGNTAGLLAVLEENLNKYHPNMVVAMMGYNDRYVIYYKDIPEVNTGLFRHSRLYRFMRLIYLHISKRFKKKDYYRQDRNIPDSKTAEFLNKRIISGYKRLLNKAIEINPKNDWAYIGLGRVYQAEGKLPEAEELYGVAIGLNPRNKMICRKIFLEGNKFLDIKALFRKIIELNPQGDGAYTGLGSICHLTGKFSEAEELYNKAIELNPRNDFAYFGLGWTYRMEGKFLRAEELIAKAIELNPRNDWAYIILGDINWSFRGRPHEISEGLFRRAIELNPEKDAWAYNRLGYVLLQRGRFSEAEEIYRKAIKIRPQEERAYIELGMAYQSQGRFMEAEKLYKKAIELSPGNDTAYRALSILSREMNEKVLVEGYDKKAAKLEINEYSPVAAANYRKLKRILDQRGIKLICVQYPMRSIEFLKKVFIGQDNIIFVDNEKIFKEAVDMGSYWDYFVDMFAGDFGHCTLKGNKLLSANIADVILKEVFHK